MNESELLIEQIKEHAGEYIEMSQNPDAMVSGILSKYVIELINEVIYLQRRLDHVCNTR